MAVGNTTNFNGELLDNLYKVIGLENDVAAKGAIHLITDVSSKLQLDYLTTQTNPLQDYTDGEPTFANVHTKAKNELNPEKFTVSGDITPSAWLSVWRKYQSIGTLTQLEANPQLLSDVLDLVKRSVNEQIALLIWQGDKAAGGGSPLRFFDGLIKKIAADVLTIKITPQGVITKANIVDILEACYEATPTKFIDDPAFKYHVSILDYKLLQLFNNDVKKTTVGVLNQVIQDMFLNQKIVAFQSLPKDHIIGAVSQISEDSNLVMGMRFGMDAEAQSMIVGKKTKFSKVVGYRFDGMADVQIRYGGDIIYYEPV